MNYREEQQKKATLSLPLKRDKYDKYDDKIKFKLRDTL